MYLQSILRFPLSSRCNSISFLRITGAKDWDRITSAATYSATPPREWPFSNTSWQSQTLPFCTFGWQLPKLLVQSDVLPLLLMGFISEKMKPWIQPVWILLHRSCVWNGVTKPVTESKNKSYLWTLVRSLTTHMFSLYLLQPVSAVSSLFAMHLWLWEFLCRNLPQLKISVTSLLGILLKIKIYLTISVFLHHGWCCEMC